MSRALSIRELRVSDSERTEYLAAVPERRSAAAAANSHFWLFEHASERGRFVEFLETPDAEVLARLLECSGTPDHWCEVTGG